MKSIWSFQVKFEIKGNKYNFAKIKAQVIVKRWREVKKPKTVKSDSAILEERTKRPRYMRIYRSKRSSSKQEHKENALASGAEERRDKLR